MLSVDQRQPKSYKKCIHGLACQAELSSRMHINAQETVIVWDLKDDYRVSKIYWFGFSDTAKAEYTSIKELPPCSCNDMCVDVSIKVH